MGVVGSHLAIFVAVIAALFTLGSFIIVQQGDHRVLRFWFGLLTACFVFILVVALLTLVVT